MDQQQLRTLKLLEALDAREATTQRELARDLNISLGLVNAFMKRLAKKGYFKIRTIPRNRVKYLLTPQGFREKSRLTYDYIHYSIGFYREIKAVLRALFSRLEREGVERLALYGCEEVAELAYLFLQDTSIALVAVFDATGDGRVFYGHPVRGCEALANTPFDYVLITQTDDINTHRDRLVEAGVHPDRVLHLSTSPAQHRFRWRE
jgi:DNA-binding MarR family transcriptional regulator